MVLEVDSGGPRPVFIDVFKGFSSIQAAAAIRIAPDGEPFELYEHAVLRSDSHLCALTSLTAFIDRSRS